MGLLLLAVALLGPSLEQRPVQAVTRDLQVQLIVDVSRSMGVRDAGPSRLESGIQGALRLMGALPGARVGLTVFGTSAHTLLPPTRDREVVRLYLAALEAGMMSREGSTVRALEDALRLASDPSTPDDPDPADHVILVTDGELWEGGPPGGQRSARATDPTRAPEIHVLWTRRPMAGSLATGISRARDDQTRPLAAWGGGLHVPVDDLPALAMLERRLVADARSVGAPTRETESVDAAPPLAAGAGLLLALAVLLRRRP
jgi:Ca-activated chloride channel family protein